MGPPRAPRVSFPRPADDATLPTTAGSQFPWVYLDDARLPEFPVVRYEDRGRRVELRGDVAAIEAIAPGTYVVSAATPDRVRGVRIVSGVPVPSMADGPLQLWAAGVLDTTAPLGNVAIGDQHGTMLFAAMSGFAPGQRTRCGDFTIAIGPVREDLAPGGVEPGYRPAHYVCFAHGERVGYAAPGEWRWIDGGDGGYFVSGVAMGASRDGRTPASLSFSFARPAPLPRRPAGDPNSEAAIATQAQRASALYALVRELVPTLRRAADAPALHAVLSERVVALHGALPTEGARHRMNAAVRAFFAARGMIVAIDDRTTA